MAGGKGNRTRRYGDSAIRSDAHRARPRASGKRTAGALAEDRARSEPAIAPRAPARFRGWGSFRKSNRTGGRLTLAAGRKSRCALDFACDAAATLTGGSRRVAVGPGRRVDSRRAESSGRGWLVAVFVRKNGFANGNRWNRCARGNSNCVGDLELSVARNNGHLDRFFADRQHRKKGCTGLIAVRFGIDSNGWNTNYGQIAGLFIQNQSILAVGRGGEVTALLPHID